VADVNINQVFASTYDAVVSDGPIDQIFTSQALLELLGDQGFKESVSGGKQFEFSLEYATNTSFQSISEYGSVSTNPVTVFDAAQYTERFWAGTIVFSDVEELRNQVENRKFDVVKAKIKNGMSSAMEGLEIMLCADGSGALDMNGLQNLISTTPTTGTVGGVNRATWSFFRNRANDGTKTTTIYDNLVTQWQLTYDQCSNGGTTNAPTGVYTDRATFGGYKKQLTLIEQLVKNDSKMANANGGDIGWNNEALSFNQKPVMYSENAPANNAYMLNSNFLKLCYLKGGWMKRKDPVEPANNFTRVHRVLTVGQFCVGASRHLGVIYNSAS
jgi:hypothetical protein